MFEHKRVIELMTELEYQDLFADFGIGKGLREYERGKKLIWKNWIIEDEQKWETIVKELARWCEV